MHRPYLDASISLLRTLFRWNPILMHRAPTHGRQILQKETIADLLMTRLSCWSFLVPQPSHASCLPPVNPLLYAPDDFFRPLKRIMPQSSFSALVLLLVCGDQVDFNELLSTARTFYWVKGASSAVHTSARLALLQSVSFTLALSGMLASSTMHSHWFVVERSLHLPTCFLFTGDVEWSPRNGENSRRWTRLGLLHLFISGIFSFFCRYMI